MSFLGIIGSRQGTGLSALQREPSFSLFVTIGLANFCCPFDRSWRGNDNGAVHTIGLSLVPSAD
jgi:hypothetical protein